MTALAWTTDNRLLVRHDAPGPRNAFIPRVFDRHMRELRSWASVPGASLPTRFDTVGNSAVSYGTTRLTLAGQTGPARVLAEIRLAGTADVVALPGESFATDSPVVGALTPPPSTDSPAWPMLAGLLLIGVGVMGSGRVLR